MANISGSLLNSVLPARNPVAEGMGGNPHRDPPEWLRRLYYEGIVPEYNGPPKNQVIPEPRMPKFPRPRLPTNPWDQMPSIKDLLRQRQELRERQERERELLEQRIREMQPGDYIPDTLNRLPAGSPRSFQGGYILPGGVLATMA
jgi:hypothetical protein